MSNCPTRASSLIRQLVRLWASAAAEGFRQVTEYTDANASETEAWGRAYHYLRDARCTMHEKVMLFNLHVGSLRKRRRRVNLPASRLISCADSIRLVASVRQRIFSTANLLKAWRWRSSLIRNGICRASCQRQRPRLALVACKHCHVTGIVTCRGYAGALSLILARRLSDIS